MDNNKSLPSKFFYGLLAFATLLALTVVLLGAYTRLTEAGLGCPDWPGCYGHVTVPSEARAAVAYPDQPLEAGKAWTEMVHRYFASTLGLIIVTILVLAWRQRSNEHYPKALPLALFGLVVFQGLLGMWTVTLKLHPTIVMLHLIGGFTTLSLLWSTWLRSLPLKLPPQFEQLKFRGLALAGLLVLIVQIFLGGWTSANYAAVICPDFPMCQGQWLPPLDFKDAFNLIQPLGPNFAGGLLENTARVTVHMTHRLGALITALLLASLFVKILRHSQNPLIRKITYAIGGLLVLQVSLGILNIVKLLPLSIAVAHNGVAALLLLALVALNICLWQHNNKGIG